MISSFVLKYGKTLNTVLYVLILLSLLGFVMIAPFKYGCSEKTAWIQVAATAGLIVWLFLARRIFRTFQD
jgi:hypothetical protein